MLSGVAILSSLALANAATLSSRNWDWVHPSVDTIHKPAGAPADNKSGTNLCSPVFDERPVSVANSAVVFGIGEGGIKEGNVLAAQPNDFEKALIVFKAIGSHTPTQYTLTSFNDSSLNIVGKSYEDLVWAKPNRDPNQLFTLQCTFGCTPPGSVIGDGAFVADGCTLKSVPTGQCVQIGDGPTAGSQGDPIFLEDCDGSDSQRFNLPITSSIPSSTPDETSDKPEDKGDEAVDKDGVPILLPTGTTEICSPEFDLFPYSIHNSGVTIGTTGGIGNGKPVKTSGESFTKGLFTFKKHDTFPPEYSAILFNDTSLGLSAASNGEIVFKTSVGNDDERFFIECSSGCSPGGLISDQSFIADGCRIRSAKTKQCIQNGAGSGHSQSTIVTLGTCAGPKGADNQRFNIIKTVTGVPVPTVANPNRFRVIVGPDGRLDYETASVKAAPGDLVTFEFRQKNHTATQSSFEAPCQPLGDTNPRLPGFKSGFQPVAADVRFGFPEFTITVNDTAPIWGYCGQTGHCGKGMVFAINAPAQGNKTFAAFEKLAETTNGTATTTQPVANDSNQKLFGAVSDSDEDFSGEQKALLRNSYIMMGLLGAVLLALIIVIALVARRGVGLKGTASRGNYAQVSLPKSKGPDEDHSFTHPTETRYSD